MIIILYRRLLEKVLLSIIIKLENKRKNFSKHCIDRDIPHKVVKCRCTRKISIAIVIISLLIQLSLIVILPLLLIKHNSNRLKSTPSLRWNTTGITVAGVEGVEGAVYIVDRYKYRIMSFKSIWSNGTLVLGGVNGTGPNKTELSLPQDLHFDYVSNSLIISNTDSHNIIRYVLGADSYTRVAGNPNGSPGSTPTSFIFPVGVTVDPMGHIYVADRFNNRIQFFDHDGSNGITIAGFSGLGNNNATALRTPRSVKLYSQLNLYVADTSNHRIQKFLRY